MLIITGSDDNYVPGVLVLIASAAFHNPKARFAVLDMGMSPESRARIDALAARLSVSIDRIEVSEKSFETLAVKRAHLTRSAFLRLLIPDLFPQETRAIYLDCDMVVMDDLSELNDMELGGNLFAAAPCPAPHPKELLATGHIRGTYVNSGLLVMDLDAWRAERVAELCIALLSDQENPLLCEDQSAVNIIARGRILHLPARYNVYSDPSSYERTGDLPLSPAVLHYVVNNKPWNLPVPLSPIWEFHAARISDLIPPRRQLSLRRRLSLINRDRKMLIGVAMRRRKYRVRQSVLTLMTGALTTSYLDRARMIEERRGA